MAKIDSPRISVYIVRILVAIEAHLPNTSSSTITIHNNFRLRSIPSPFLSLNLI